MQYLHHRTDLVQCMCPPLTLTATGAQFAALSHVYHLLTPSDAQDQPRARLVLCVGGRQEMVHV